MSRIGKVPIPLPNGVSAEIKGNSVSVKGAKGSLSGSFHHDMMIELKDGVITVNRPSDANHHKALHGLTRSLINNMVVGVSEGYTRKLIIEGVGYRAETKGNTLVLNLGYSHPIEVAPPTPDVKFVAEDRGKTLFVSGIDKQVVGEICAYIRKQRPPEPYKGKGVRYDGEYIRRKAGKAGKV